MKLYLLLICSISSLCLLSCSASRLEKNLAEIADEIHLKILSIDTHVDTPLRFVNSNFDLSVKHNSREEGSKLDFPRMKEGGLDAVFFAAFVGQGPRTPEGNMKAKESILRTIDSIKSKLVQNNSIAELALNADDAYQIKKKGMRAVYIGMENGYPVGSDLTLIKTYYDLGVRYITLCHTKNNDICDSSLDPDSAEHKGLSAFGKKVIAEMNRVGMIIDISHVSDKAFYDVIELTKVPVIASHSSVRSLCDNPRNLTDEMLRKLAENGGVIQICIFTEYLKTPELNPARDSVFQIFRETYSNYENLSDEERAKARAERIELDKKFQRKLATVSDVVDHIDHVVKIAGIDHVGIGTDFDGGGGVDGCFDVSEMKNITIELLRRGYSEKEIEKIWSGNFMR
ncbi:MAG: dipeptidase, partial [Bacteroidetes bacterium]|nr:dipeptidase [Bacteroidota bacterium]